MVEVERIATAYRSYKGTFESEIDSLNEALIEIGINCEVISKVCDDGESLIFKRIDL